MAGKKEVSFLFKCVQQAKITGEDAINIISNDRSSGTTGAIGIQSEPKIHHPTRTAAGTAAGSNVSKPHFNLTMNI